MRRGKLHAWLLIAMFVIAFAAMVTFGEAGTNWNGSTPNVSPSPIPPAPGAPTMQASLASADTTAPKGDPVQPDTECAVQCVQQVQCVQTQYVPVRTVRYYNVASAAPQYNVGCAGAAAVNVGCQRVGLLNRFRARRALFRSNAQAYAHVGCGG